jgi:hypothetical protein
MTFELLMTILFFGAGLILPWSVALWQSWSARKEPRERISTGGYPILNSMLSYVLAFNLTFFIQELFLVLPKALVPGLTPTLYHNNHRWVGEAPIADLFQGTGALAILVSGLLCLWIARRQARPGHLLLWMAFHGLFQSLPQFVVGAITAGNDVGQAYDFLKLGTAGEGLLAIAALICMPVAGIAIGRRFLATAWDPAQIASVGARLHFLNRMAAMPALLAIPIIVLFRVPREVIEVLAPPILVPLFGYGWVQWAALRPGTTQAGGRPATAYLPLLAATLALLAIFQLILRPGISF